MHITYEAGESALSAIGAWSPARMHEVDGARLAVARHGKGPAVLCLHATGHGARDFAPFAERVGDRFEVLAVDWPGQGKSPREAQPASAWRYARLIEALLPQLTSHPTTLVGCSIGGAAAIEVAARRPDLVRGLVLCNPGGLAALDAPTRFVIRRMQAFFAAGARGARWFPLAFRLYYRLVLPQAAGAAQRLRIVAATCDTAPTLAQAWASFADARADVRDLARRIACPTWFAWAKQDRIIPWSRSRDAAEAIRDMRVTFFRAGHAAFLEDPDNFAREFRDFAAGL